MQPGEPTARELPLFVKGEVVAGFRIGRDVYSGQPCRAEDVVDVMTGQHPSFGQVMTPAFTAAVSERLRQRRQSLQRQQA